MVDMEGQLIRLRIRWVNTVGDLWAIAEQAGGVLEFRNMIKVRWR